MRLLLGLRSDSLLVLLWLGLLLFVSNQPAALTHAFIRGNPCHDSLLSGMHRIASRRQEKEQPKRLCAFHGSGQCPWILAQSQNKEHAVRLLAQEKEGGGGEGDRDDDPSPLVLEEEDDVTMYATPSSSLSSDSMERAWRYAKKPLLRIGAKGATSSHGNSLKQLLEQHIVVKVKVNTQPFDNNMETAFETLRKLAEERGAPAGMELLQARESSSILLLGTPGIRQRIENNEFPPQQQEQNKEGVGERNVWMRTK